MVVGKGTFMTKERSPHSEHPASSHTEQGLIPRHVDIKNCNMAQGRDFPQGKMILRACLQSAANVYYGSVISKVH